MNIKVVSEITGLTKKAIKYYENEGLISPLKNIENNYREYTKEDIVKLNLIAALRMLDIPIIEIKNVIEGKKSILEVMEETKNKINRNIDNLEKSKMVIQCIIDKNSEDYTQIGEEVKKLKETLELSIEEKKEYISTAIMRKFPGGFGKILIYMYEPFLRVVVDSDEKKRVWLDMVEYLDELGDPDENHPFIKNFNKAQENKEDNKNEEWSIQCRKLIKGDEEIKKEIKNNLGLMFKVMQENELVRNNCKETSRQCREFLNSIGYKDNTFDDFLVLLSEDYKKLKEAYKIIREELENESGINIKQVMRDSMK
ncbi:MerR family transcriptional regulator [Clostridium sp. P21]|uniref:MerR family transcriptional regulator n=1 Tax=Clostridium muellerianum TaxID=2716538 RepID=A0A7Y0HP79_9CLOT|nr:MerR family transcriptional regulator [Clostridium muellerianum]